MTSTVYVESDVADHPRTLEILSRHKNASVIEISRYGEVFNKKAQHFRTQKHSPALILAGKHNRRVLPAPPGYGVGGKHNYYFSHMLNCLYDCRYCFLQGMYQSANHVVFVNFEDFAEDLQSAARSHGNESCWFFSGYDCDSLAYEPMTGFARYFVPLFSKMDNAFLELRTKSTQVRNLLQLEALNNVIVSYSLSPQAVIDRLEARTPSLEKRINAMLQLGEAGWPIGLRFDPLIYSADFESIYGPFLEECLKRIPAKYIHSVSLGSFRLTKGHYEKISRLYPEEPLFSVATDKQAGMVSYPAAWDNNMKSFASNIILATLPDEKFFPCELQNE